jgi:hypothetical protein
VPFLPHALACASTQGFDEGRGERRREGGAAVIKIRHVRVCMPEARGEGKAKNGHRHTYTEENEGLAHAQKVGTTTSDLRMTLY